MPDSAVDAAQKVAESRDVQKACGRVGPGGLQENVVRVVPAQHVVDEIGRQGDLAPGLLAARMTTFDEAGDHRYLAERALHQVRLRQPRVEVVAEHILGEQLVEIELAGGDERRDVAKPPQRHAVVVGDEAKGSGADAVEAARQQHAERLVGKPPLERIGDEVVAAAAGERFDQHLVAAGNDRALLLQLEPIGDGRRQPAPCVVVGEHGAHALREVRR